MKEFFKDDPFEEIFEKKASRIQPTLKYFAEAMDALDLSQHIKPFILVGGTNGKGTTSGYIWQLLAWSAQKAQKIGYFTSPHLREFRERFQISGIDLTNNILEEEFFFLKNNLSAALYDSLSFFEVSTLIAHLLFKRFDTSYNVWEVGMGGVWDTTNFGHPAVAVISSIGLDHQLYLGPTLGDIAAQKAGIMRPGSPLCLGKMDPAIDLFFRTRAKELKSPVLSYGTDFFYSPSDNTYCSPFYSSSALLPAKFTRKPPFLQHNVALALGAYESFQKIFPEFQLLSKELLQNAFCGPHIPHTHIGRFHQIQLTEEQKTQVIFDVCHNPQGAEAFCAGLRALYPSEVFPLPALISILRDKDIRGILKVLEGTLSIQAMFGILSERTLTREDAGAFAHLYHPTFAEAWASTENLLAQNKPLVICGSVAAVGEALAVLRCNFPHFHTLSE